MLCINHVIQFQNEISICSSGWKILDVYSMWYEASIYTPLILSYPVSKHQHGWLLVCVTTRRLVITGRREPRTRQCSAAAGAARGHLSAGKSNLRLGTARHREDVRRAVSSSQSTVKHDAQRQERSLNCSSAQGPFEGAEAALRVRQLHRAVFHKATPELDMQSAEGALQPRRLCNAGRWPCA